MNAHSVDVTLHNFEAEVIEASFSVPVVVDFWAPWCQPCQTLKPILEQLAVEYGGRFRLVKIDSDANPELAAEFGVRSIPAVKAVAGGQIVNEFTGAQPESAVRAFIESLLPSPAEPLRAEAAQLAAAGRPEEALVRLIEASSLDPANEAVRLDGIELLIALGRDDEAQTLLGTDFPTQGARAQALAARLKLKAGAGDRAALEARLSAAPDDHATRLELSRTLAAQGDARGALEQAFEVVRRDRAWNEGGGRRAMLELFEAFGQNEALDDLVREFRRALSAQLN